MTMVNLGRAVAEHEVLSKHCRGRAQWWCEPSVHPTLCHLDQFKETGTAEKACTWIWCTRSLSYSTITFSHFCTRDEYWLLGQELMSCEGVYNMHRGLNGETPPQQTVYTSMQSRISCQWYYEPVFCLHTINTGQLSWKAGSTTSPNKPPEAIHMEDIPWASLGSPLHILTVPATG